MHLLLGLEWYIKNFRLIESFTIKDNLTLSKANIFSDNFEEAYEKYSEIFTLNSSYLTPINELSVGENKSRDNEYFKIVNYAS